MVRKTYRVTRFGRGEDDVTRFAVMDRKNVTRDQIYTWLGRDTIIDSTKRVEYFVGCCLAVKSASPTLQRV